MVGRAGSGHKARRRRGVMRTLPQQDHCDLGLVDDDLTPDMRKAPAATEALRSEQPHHANDWKEVQPL